jgi:hypothetical protein
MRINIIGAGMSGLLAANMLRRHDVTIFEKQDKLPNNHHAVLRFRTPEVGHILGIAFKKVNMIKTYVPHKNIVADSLSYSKKVTGKYLSNRSIIDGTVMAERYIAPTDLITQMAKNINIDYNKTDIENTPCISTMPMPLLMTILQYKNDIEFNHMSGSVYTANIRDCDAYVSVLFPGPEPYSRATITGNQLIVEYPNIDEYKSDTTFDINFDLGIGDAKLYNGEFRKQEYFKIMEINEAERKKFIRWATVHQNIYSLGRYATWRPKLLLDDLIQDIRKIESWIVGGNR